MANRIEPNPVAVFLLAIGSWATSFAIFGRFSGFLQHRYFHSDDQPYLLFTWESFWLIPLLSGITGGLVAGALFRRGSVWFPLVVGFSLGVACLDLFDFYASRSVLAISISVAVLSSCAYYLAQVVAKAPRAQ
jgi:hypothetical protein